MLIFGIVDAIPSRAQTTKFGRIDTIKTTLSLNYNGAIKEHKIYMN